MTYDSYNSNSADWTIYAFSALTMVGMVPFTKLTIDGINAALIAEGGADGGGGGVGGGGSHVLMPRNTKATGLREGEEEEVQELVTRWRFWNLMRMAMPLVGTVVGLWTALNRYERSALPPLDVQYSRRKPCWPRSGLISQNTPTGPPSPLPPLESTADSAPAPSYTPSPPPPP